ncbi:MAG: ATP-binding cassette domain-containing protein, partial [Acidimicrobiales bacterium]|nr:ATP-binding cassette domain-containing protein [Acidimicrobiales bacterium]
MRALDHVDLHVAAGEVIAVVGPSGSGKSSLLAVAGAMLTPTSGTILVDGVDLGAIDDAARTRLRRERVGFVFQGVNLLPSLTALEQLLLLPHLDGVRPATQRQRAAELLERVGMAHKADRRPHELSGGERQRVGIARALMVRPAVVLADEPTSALDQARSAEIAALLAAADFADRLAKPEEAAFLCETADIWNGLIERWIYVTDTPLARRVGVAGYYVRIAPPETATAASPKDGFVPIKNRPPQESIEKASRIVSPDALALVRFGLRSADDPRILDTVRVIDALLKTDLPPGPSWHRYNDDGYGEHEDGRAFDGTGIGRCWPLLTGERAHYELAAGRPERAEALLATLEASAGDGGLLPEQSWDADDIPDREL